MVIGCMYNITFWLCTIICLILDSGSSPATQMLLDLGIVGGFAAFVLVGIS